MKNDHSARHEYRLVPAAKFKATCLQLMDEVNEKTLTIIVTKRGKPVIRMDAAPRGIKLGEPTVEMPQEEPASIDEISATAEPPKATKKKDREKKRKDKKKHK